jgi:hypothetical protein
VKKAAPAKRAVATAAPVKKAVAKAAPAKKAPARQAPAKVEAPIAKASTRTPVAQKVAAARAPVRRPARALTVVPDPPVTTSGKPPSKPSTKRPTAAERDGVKTRATVPGWADVLLGTSPGSDR